MDVHPFTLCDGDAGNPDGVADPTIDLQLSTDNGGSWSTIAGNLTMDALGRGSYDWTAGPASSGYSALVRATAHDASQPQDTSDEPFMIVGETTDYYVNDDATDGIDDSDKGLHINFIVKLL